MLFDGDATDRCALRQPAYPATVDLVGQSIRADARDVPLQSGMLFSADIILERRTILEWVFEPLFRMRGRG